MLNKITHFITHNIIHVDDSPNRIALGAAIGLFISWTPAVGLHTLLVLAVTSLTKANKFVAIAFSLVFNFITAPLILYTNYVLGGIILNRFRDGPPLSQEQVTALFKDLFTSGSIITNFYHTEFWQKLVTLLINIGPELWIGGFLIGSIVAIAGYLACYNFVNWQRKNPSRRFQKDSKT